jgi:hypothetical protein
MIAAFRGARVRTRNRKASLEKAPENCGVRQLRCRFCVYRCVLAQEKRELPHSKAPGALQIEDLVVAELAVINLCVPVIPIVIPGRKPRGISSLGSRTSRIAAGGGKIVAARGRFVFSLFLDSLCFQ